MSELFNSEGASASCNCVSARIEFPAVSTEPTARERKARVRGRPPDSQPVQQHAERVLLMRQAQQMLEKQTAGNGSNTEPKVHATPTASVPDCMGSDPGRYPANSNPNPAAMCAAVVVNRDTALTDDVDRGMLTVQTAVNVTHPVDSSIAVAVHRKTELTDDVDRDIASAANTAAIDTELTRSLCKLIGVVYCDVNCSSSKESDCIRSGPIQADLHNPECSSVPAGTVVNAPLNVSPALSLHTSLAQPHSASEQARHSVPYSRQQGEYPPRVSDESVRGDLSPPCYDGVNPKGLPSDSASPAQAGGKILGLVVHHSRTLRLVHLLQNSTHRG